VPIKKAAFKSLRKSRKKHEKNITTKSELKSLVKNFEKLVAAKKAEESKKALSIVVSKMDRAVTKGVIKPNTASRKIARLMMKLPGAVSKA
jgi:small subunit ribosomal protein S20